MDFLNPEALKETFFGTETPEESRCCSFAGAEWGKKKKCCKKFKKGKQCKKCPKR